jgi:broad specificity phosphatase PhoE
VRRHWQRSGILKRRKPTIPETMLLVRHGQTEANLNRIHHGRLDSPLTDRGVEQAQAIGTHIAMLADAKPFRMIASPQPRARRTAEIIRQCLGAPAPALSIDDRLREVEIGDWDGLTQEKIELIAPGTFDGDGRYEWCFRAPGGETYEGFSGRIADWLKEAADDPSLIVVTHGIVARVLRGHYAGLPRLAALSLPIPQDRIFRLSQGAIEEIMIEAGRRAVRLTRVAALPDYNLFIHFENGVTGTLDVRAGLSGSVPFQDETEFRRVTVDDFGTICWPTGQALSADLAYEWLTSRSSTTP